MLRVRLRGYKVLCSTKPHRLANRINFYFDIRGDLHIPARKNLPAGRLAL